ncbi:MAG: PEP/pyruvate-binding domain-containing protein [Polyangiales bacterium]
MIALVPLNSSRDAARFGHKAAGLAALLEVPGLRVPGGFAVEVAAFAQHVRSVLPAGQWPERLAQGDPTARRADRLEAIRARLEHAPLDPVFEAALLDAWRTLGGGAVAVRSSALHEDAAGGSAAGLQETVLGVEGEAALRDAVRRVWSSIFTERAMTYLARALRGSGAAVGVAVVVQRMVSAERAGVLFTADPLRDDPGVAVIEATRGLGCAVVDGVVSPEVLRVRRADGVVVARQGVAAEPVLSEGDVRELLHAAAAVERAAGSPRDIEWCFAAGALWLLQSRPIVRRSAQRVGHGLSPDRSQWVWSNVNVGEALPGVATPLTWSVAAKFSDHGFRSAFHSLGCEVPPGAELVGSFHGRIYLNLTHFMQIARQVPALNARMLLEFGGGGGAEEIERQVEPGRWGPFLRRAPAVGIRLAAENARLDARLADFERAFAEARRRSASRALGAVSNDALATALDDAHALLDHTGRVMLSCASGYLGSVVAMRALLRRAVEGEAERFEQELLAGFSDLESAAPGVALFHIAEVARSSPTRAR